MWYCYIRSQGDEMALPPCLADPELYFDPEPPEELTSFDQERDEGYRLAMARLKTETAERRLKAQLTCLETCPMVEACRELGRDEEFGVWGGTTPDDREAVREGRPKKPRNLRSKGGGTRIMLSRQLIGGVSISQMAEMHGTTRKSTMGQLQQRVAELSTPSDNLKVA